MVVVAGRARGISVQEGVWPTRGLHAVNAIPRTYQRFGPVEQVLVVRAGRVGRAVVATLASSTVRGPTYCTALVLQAGWAQVGVGGDRRARDVSQQGHATQPRVRPCPRMYPADGRIHIDPSRPSLLSQWLITKYKPISAHGGSTLGF